MTPIWLMASSAGNSLNQPKPMKTNLLSLGFLSLVAVDTLALSQLTLSLPEALCVMLLFLWSTVLLWRSLLS